MPNNDFRGGPWRVVPDDIFEGQRYYRQRLPAPGITPEAFTVLVGDRWVASMQTKEWMEIALMNMLREDLPPVVAGVFPYRLVSGMLIGGSDGYICAVLHESFHAYEGMTAPGHLADAEMAIRRYEARYPWEDQAPQDAWQVELDLLAQALQATSNKEASELARQFLAQRKQRREENALDPVLADYERQRVLLAGISSASVARP